MSLKYTTQWLPLRHLQKSVQWMWYEKEVYLVLVRAGKAKHVSVKAQVKKQRLWIDKLRPSSPQCLPGRVPLASHRSIRRRLGQFSDIFRCTQLPGWSCHVLVQHATPGGAWDSTFRVSSRWHYPTNPQTTWRGKSLSRCSKLEATLSRMNLQVGAHSPYLQNRDFATNLCQRTSGMTSE